MKNTASFNDLEREHKILVHSMRLPDSILGGHAGSEWKHLDLAFARELIGSGQPWGTEDVFDPRNRIVTDVFLGSEDGRRLYYASENDMLRQIKESGVDQEHKGPFDVRESIFPVRVRGQVIHLVRTGKYRTAPFSEKDLNELAFLCGVSLKTVREAVACLPVYTPEQVDYLRETNARLRDSIKLAFREHIRLAEMTAQQLQQERLSSLGTLAEGMAHHFSNLLSIILGYSSLLLDRAEIDKEDAQTISKITEAAQRGRRFTEEVMALSGALSDEEPSVCSLHERLQGVLTLMQRKLKAGIELVNELNAENDRIVAPPGIIHHIAFNAVTSAIDSMPGGGILTLRTANVEEREGDQMRSLLRITVTDTGFMPLRAGVPQSPSDTSSGERLAPKMAGLLGLVASLDGFATVQTEKDQTTVLEITLPTATAAEMESPSPRVRRRLAPSRIWVADDDPVIREMCRRVLVEDEHDVEEVASGNEFMSQFAACETAPELLIYDFGMPDVTGHEIARWLRDNGHRIPVILVTGYSADHPEVKKTLKLRKTFLLQKPFSFRDMSDLVTIALGETLIEEVPVR